MNREPSLGQGDYENLKLHLKALDVGLWDYDLDADILSCDSRWYEIMGLRPGTVTSIGDFRPHIHPDDVVEATTADPDAIMATIALDGRYHIDFRIVRPGGEIRWIRSVACIIFDPGTGHRRALGCAIDNSDFRLIDPSPSREAPDGIAAPHDPAEEAAEGLSAKELECLRWVSVGKTAWETAIIMNRSQRTIEFHLVNAMRKLSAANKVHAVVIAVRRGLI